MRILIIGAGNVGSHLAKLLSLRGNEVLIVDKDEKKIDSVQSEADVQGFVRDATDPNLYDDIDLRSIDVLVAATNRDEVNLLAATIANDYGVPRIVARTRTPKIAKIMERIGVEYTITEPIAVAKLMDAIIEGKYHAVSLAPVMTGNYVLASITITENDSSVGKMLSEIIYPSEGVKLLAVFDGEKLREPVANMELSPNNIVIALVRRDKLEDFEKAFR